LYFDLDQFFFVIVGDNMYRWLGQ